MYPFSGTLIRKLFSPFMKGEVPLNYTSSLLLEKKKIKKKLVRPIYHLGEYMGTKTKGDTWGGSRMIT